MAIRKRCQGLESWNHHRSELARQRYPIPTWAASLSVQKVMGVGVRVSRARLLRRPLVLMMGMALCLSAVQAPAHATVRPAQGGCDELWPDAIGGRQTCPVKPDPRKHYLMIGSSVTRLSDVALESTIPNLVVDAANGRGWGHRSSDGGPDLWQTYLNHRAELRAGDWLIFENERADVSIAVNRTYIDRLKASLPAGVCIGWVLPHVYYATQGATQTALTKQWNTEMTALVKSEFDSYPCHAYADWDSVVVQATAQATNLSAADVKAWEPLCYDGRHPTVLGTLAYANVIALALKHPVLKRAVRLMRTRWR